MLRSPLFVLSISLVNWVWGFFLIYLAGGKNAAQSTVGFNQSTSTNSALKTYGKDLVQQAGKLDLVIGRDEDIRRVLHILSRRTKNIPVLIGEPGVGKTAVVEGLAQRIARGDVPSNLAGVRLIALDLSNLFTVSNLKAVLKEVEEAKGKVILLIDEIHLILGGGTNMDASNLLKSMLARGQFSCIGATTIKEYRKYVEEDAAFERGFQQVYVSEPSIPDTISILRGLKERYEAHHGVQIQDRALVVAAQLSARYITGMLGSFQYNVINFLCYLYIYFFYLSGLC